MKSYAPNDIKYRMIQRLKEYSNWEKIIEDSAIDTILNSFSEALSETDRYLEYNVRERTWNTAQNPSSVYQQIKYFGYKPKRKISAIGTITISHDPNLQELTSTTQLENLSIYTGGSFTIPEGTALLKDGIPYITSESTTYSTSDIPTESNYQRKYIQVSVIQGEKITVTTTPETTTGTAFEILRINTPNIEAAADDVSKRYLSVTALTVDNASFVCEAVDSIFLATNEMYAYELNTIIADDPLDDYVELTFGNNVSGKILPAQTTIKVSYLSTLGVNGDIPENFSYNGSIAFDNEGTDTQLYYTNITALAGGKEREELEDIKANALVHYLTEGAIVTENQYKAVVEQIPSVQKAIVFGGEYTDPVTSQTNDVIFFSAVNDSGDTPDSTEIEDQLYDRILNKKPPLDIVKFIEPNFINVVVNYLAEISSESKSNKEGIKNSIITVLTDAYDISQMDFQQGIALPDIYKLVTNSIGSSVIKSESSFLEAKEILKASSFTPTDINPGVYERDFIFDESFTSIKTDGLYLFRIDFTWSCDNVSNKNKTLLVFKNLEYDPDNVNAAPYFIVRQYPLITRIITSDYLQNFILADGTEPTEIVEGDENYYPFNISYITGSELCEGNIKIDTSYNNTTYIDFINKTPEELDTCVEIAVYAYPLNSTSDIIIPKEKNGIIKIEETSIKVEVN